jgi:hypothetical protein
VIILKTRPLIILLLFVSQVLLMSCATTKHELQLGNVEASNINNQVHAKVYELMNTLETVRPVFLEIQSFTPNTIVFKNNFSVRIFQQTNNGWKEISEEPTTRLPEDDIVFSPDKGTLQIFAVHPHLNDYTHNVQLRIYLIGDMKTGQGTTKVAAYTDVTLHP